MEAIVTNGIALIAGVSLGLNMADWDHKLPLMSHRSVWTHGIFLPILAWWLLVSGYSYADPYFEDAKFNADDWVRLLRYFGLGFFPGYAIHMCFDLYPKKWHGGAFIKSPFGSFPAGASFLWLLCGQLVATYLAIRLVRTPTEAFILMVGSGFLFSFYRKHEDTRWRPVATMIAVAALLIFLDPPTWWDPAWIQ